MFRRILGYFYKMILTVKKNLHVHHDIGEKLFQILDDQIQQGLVLEHASGMIPKVKIHEFRKSVKRSRSLLRVLKSRIPDKNYWIIDNLLGSAARNVSYPRESTVNLRTFMDLCLHNNSHLSPEIVNQIRARLAKEVLEAYSEKEDHLVKMMNDSFRMLFNAHFQLNGQKLGSFSASDLEIFLDKTYRKAQKLFKSSYDSFDTEILHKWRRYSKHLLFQLKFTPHSFQSEGSEYLEKLERITDQLGNDHDLAILEEFIEKNISINPEELKQIKLAIMGVRSALQKNAFEMGNQYFSKISVKDYLSQSTSKTLS